MDFAEDRMVSGRRFQSLLVKDEAGVFCVALPVSLSFKGIDVLRALEQAVSRYGKPAYLRCDNVLTAKSSADGHAKSSEAVLDVLEIRCLRCYRKMPVGFHNRQDPLI